MKKTIALIISSIASLIIFIGCETYNTQSTSGRDYLSKYVRPTGTQSDIDIDEEIKAIADVEPTLRFPARIGLAKIFKGQIANLSPEEAGEWNNLKTELGSDFGEFVPVSPLVAESVYKGPKNPNHHNKASDLLNKIRLGSARQHLDVVLIYEVFSESDQTELATSVTDWTIIGAYLIPSKEIKTTGFANALLMDIRSGYPYGTASATLTAEDYGTTWNSYGKMKNLATENQIATALKLIPEVQKMMVELMENLKHVDLARS